MRLDLEFPYCLSARERGSWKIAFPRLFTLFQRDCWLSLRVILISQNWFAREISPQFFSGVFVRDFRKDELNFRLHRKISTLLWIRHSSRRIKSRVDDIVCAWVCKWNMTLVSHFYLMPLLFIFKYLNENMALLNYTVIEKEILFQQTWFIYSIQVSQ